jgi:hypothetical protein
MRRQIQPMGSATSLPAYAPYATRDYNLHLPLLLCTPAPSRLQLRPASPAEREEERRGEDEDTYMTSCGNCRSAGWLVHQRSQEQAFFIAVRLTPSFHYCKVKEIS